jgi:DHA2 family multidrug resistance protein
MPTRRSEEARRFDRTGFILLSAALTLPPRVLDRGQTKDWFSSTEFLGEAFFAAVFLYMLVAHELTARHPLIEPQLFCDRTSSSAC